MAFDSDGNWIPDETGLTDPNADNMLGDSGGLLDSNNPNNFDINTADFSQYGYDPGGGGGQFIGQSLDGGGFGNLLSGLGGLLTSGLGALPGLFSNILSGPGGRGWGSIVPGTLALAYANKQPGVDTTGLEGITSSLRGNMNPIIQAAIDPMQRNFAAGYGDLLQSHAKRGIRGSSFGDTAIGDYMATGNRSIADAAANAAQGSLALQGSLEGNIAQLKQKSQEMKNSLFGRAFDTLGRGLNPAGYGMYPTG